MSKANATALLLPVLIVTAIVFLGPLLLLARYSLNEFQPGLFMVPGLTVENYINIVTDPYYRRVLFDTLVMGACITLLSLVLGFPLARFISQSRKLKKILILCVILPLFIGNAVRAAGWILAFGEAGIINSLLMWAGLIDTPIQIMYSWFAVLIGAAAVNTPFVVLTIQSVLDGLNPYVEEASASLGATPVVTFFKVTLPMAMPGIKAAAILSFILGVNAYATPVLLGGPSFRMMAPAIADEMIAKNNWPVGAALAFVLIATTLAMTTLISWSRRKSGNAGQAG